MTTARGAQGGNAPPSRLIATAREQSLPEELQRDGEAERDLAERLEVHRRGLEAVEGRPCERAANHAADERRAATASTSTETTTGMLSKPSARSVAISRVRRPPPGTSCSPRAKIAPTPIDPVITQPMLRMITAASRDCSA